MTNYKTRIWKPFDKESYRLAWNEKKFAGIITEFNRDLKRCYQRVWRGYCDYDLFSIYNWFLGIMPAMLQEFRDTKHSYPLIPNAVSHKFFFMEMTAKMIKALRYGMKYWTE